MARKENFSSQYITTNVSPQAVPFDNEEFHGFLSRIQEIDKDQIGKVAPGILVAMLCGQRRGDLVSKLFNQLSFDLPDRDTLSLFLSVREALGLISCFVGLPNIMPAVFGLVGEMDSRNIEVPHDSMRTDFLHGDWASKGRETRTAIYSRVGNPEVHEMLAQYFPDIFNTAETAIFGYLITGSLAVQSLTQSQMIVAAAIISMGALRQARSHCKAALGLGNSVSVVKEVVRVAFDLAAWNHMAMPGNIDVDALAAELERI